MKVGLIDVDGHNFPNLALMKISRYWKNNGADVEWYSPFDYYDIVYLSKVFTFTADYEQCITNADKIERGGTGYRMYDKNLPIVIDSLQPDYSIYSHIVDNKSAFGFLTRGCIRRCKWCIVPKKEGYLRPYMDIEEIAIEGRTKVTLMDNNILASDYGLRQIEKIIKKNLRVDFNQDLDCRLVTEDVAKMLVKVKWQRYIRFACDTSAEIEPLFRACELLKHNGYRGEVFMNVLLTEDIRECVSRINAIKKFGEKNRMQMLPFAQPYIDFEGHRNPPQWQKDMAHWCNKKAVFKSCDFEDFSPRKGFYCRTYLKDRI